MEKNYWFLKFEISPLTKTLFKYSSPSILFFIYLFKSVTEIGLYSTPNTSLFSYAYKLFSFTTVANTPFINELEVSSPYLLANSTTSFITTLYGTFL